MLLIDTVSLMTSDDYADRFKAEYYQLKIRYEKLRDMVDNWDSLDFQPTCNKGIYRDQLFAMKAYLDILLYRADKENIVLDK